jgi:hypothetical protein
MSQGKSRVNPINTHGAYDPKYDSEIFSDTYDGRGDIPFAKSHEIDGYLATPSGKLSIFRNGSSINF